MENHRPVIRVKDFAKIHESNPPQRQRPPSPPKRVSIDDLLNIDFGDLLEGTPSAPNQKISHETHRNQDPLSFSRSMTNHAPLRTHNPFQRQGESRNSWAQSGNVAIGVYKEPLPPDSDWSGAAARAFTAKTSSTPQNVPSARISDSVRTSVGNVAQSNGQVSKSLEQMLRADIHDKVSNLVKLGAIRRLGNEKGVGNGARKVYSNKKVEPALPENVIDIFDSAPVLIENCVSLAPESQTTIASTAPPKSDVIGSTLSANHRTTSSYRTGIPVAPIVPVPQTSAPVGYSAHPSLSYPNVSSTTTCYGVASGHAAPPNQIKSPSYQGASGNNQTSTNTTTQPNMEGTTTPVNDLYTPVYQHNRNITITRINQLYVQPTTQSQMPNNTTNQSHFLSPPTSSYAPPPNQSTVIMSPTSSHQGASGNSQTMKAPPPSSSHTSKSQMPNSTTNQSHFLSPPTSSYGSPNQSTVRMPPISSHQGASGNSQTMKAPPPPSSTNTSYTPAPTSLTYIYEGTNQTAYDANQSVATSSKSVLSNTSYTTPPTYTYVPPGRPVYDINQSAALSLRPQSAGASSITQPNTSQNSYLKSNAKSQPNMQPSFITIPPGKESYVPIKPGGPYVYVSPQINSTGQLITNQMENQNAKPGSGTGKPTAVVNWQMKLPCGQPVHLTVPVITTASTAPIQKSPQISRLKSLLAELTGTTNSLPRHSVTAPPSNTDTNKIHMTSCKEVSNNSSVEGSSSEKKNPNQGYLWPHTSPITPPEKTLSPLTTKRRTKVKIRPVVKPLKLTLKKKYIEDYNRERAKKRMINRGRKTKQCGVRLDKLTDEEIEKWKKRVDPIEVINLSMSPSVLPTNDSSNLPSIPPLPAVPNECITPPLPPACNHIKREPSPIRPSTPPTPINMDISIKPDISPTPPKEEPAPVMTTVNEKEGTAVAGCLTRSDSLVTFQESLKDHTEFLCSQCGKTLEVNKFWSNIVTHEVICGFCLGNSHSSAKDGLDVFYEAVRSIVLKDSDDDDDDESLARSKERLKRQVKGLKRMGKDKVIVLEAKNSKKRRKFVIASSESSDEAL